MRRPALPAGRRLPWVLGAVSVVLLAYGLITSDEALALIGGLGAVATFVGFMLPRLVVKPADPEHEQPGATNDSP